MELLFEQRELNESEEPCEECTSKKEMEENFETYEYDYHKRLWF